MPENKLGVLFPTIKTGTGTEIFTVRLVAALKKRGVRAEIAWLPHYAEYLPWLVPILSVPDWVTVIHVNSWLHSRFIPPNLPVVVTVHSAIYDSALNSYKSYLQIIYHRYWIRRCERLCIRRADKVTAVSCYAANQAMIQFHRDGIDTIYNWIDTDVFTPIKNKKEKKVFSILYVGSSRKLKGFDLLPKIMRDLGGSFQLKCTVNVPRGVELPDNMISIGRITDENELVSLYQNADLLLCPSRLEGFGLVALEAIACGLPVVATRGTALDEIIQHGKSGYLCDSGEIQMFVDSIKRIANNKEMRYSMGRYGRHYALVNFSEEIIVKKYIEVYLSVGR